MYQRGLNIDVEKKIDINHFFQNSGTTIMRTV